MLVCRYYHTLSDTINAVCNPELLRLRYSLAQVDRLICAAPTKTSLSAAYVTLKLSNAELYMATIILNR